MTLTGCMKGYPLSEVQSDIVAEYMANRLLEKDKAFLPSLLSYQGTIDIDDIIPKIEPNKESTVAPQLSNGDEDDTSLKEDENIVYTLSEVIGESSFDIKYTSYQFADTYPDDESNLVFSVDPRVGYQLLVTNFIIENITDSDKIIDLTSSKIQYQLDINVGTMYKPQLALLENNLQYINLNVKAGSKIPAVLIFEVTKDINMSNINLIVSRDTRTEIIKIK
jgi:hypothetical protein